MEQCDLGLACLPIVQSDVWSPTFTLVHILKELELFIVDPSAVISDPLAFAKNVKLAESFHNFGHSRVLVLSDHTYSREARRRSVMLGEIDFTSGEAASGTAHEEKTKEKLEVNAI